MNIDWQQLFIPQTSLLELIIRGSIMYLMLFMLLRILVRRTTGSMSLMDLLLLVLIADAAQNGMAGNYHSITEGVVLCCTIILWSYFLDYLSFRFPAIRHLLEPSPLPVVKNGKMLRRNMRSELISTDELTSLLRQQGIEDIATVKTAYIEPEGQLSVIRIDPQHDDSSSHSPKTKAGPI